MVDLPFVEIRNCVGIWALIASKTDRRMSSANFVFLKSLLVLRTYKQVAFINFTSILLFPTQSRCLNFTVQLNSKILANNIVWFQTRVVKKHVEQQDRGFLQDIANKCNNLLKY